MVKHFELQTLTQIPAPDVRRAGTGGVLPTPNESQREGVKFRKQFFFFFLKSPHVILKCSQF